MNKVFFGIILGGVLGIFDGLSALVSAPQVRPEIAGIVVGSTIKGVLAGALIGFFARKVHSVPLGILFGAAVGFGLAYLVILAGNPYSLDPRDHASRRRGGPDRGLCDSKIRASCAANERGAVALARRLNPPPFIGKSGFDSSGNR